MQEPRQCVVRDGYLTATPAVTGTLLHTLASESGVNADECGPLERHVAVLVEHLCRADVGVAKNQLRVTRVDSEMLEQRRRGVPRVVDSDGAQSGGRSQLFKGADEVLRVDGRAGRAQQHVAVRVGASRLLLLPVATERERDARHQRHVAAAGGRLDRAAFEYGTDPMQLGTDVDHPRLPLDVVPCQAEHLATAHAVGEKQAEADRPAMMCARGEKCCGLLERPRMDLLALPPRQLDEPSNVAPDELLTLGAAER